MLVTPAMYQLYIWEKCVSFPNKISDLCFVKGRELSSHYQFLEAIQHFGSVSAVGFGENLLQQFRVLALDL